VSATGHAGSCYLYLQCCSQRRLNTFTTCYLYCIGVLPVAPEHSLLQSDHVINTRRVSDSDCRMLLYYVLCCLLWYCLGTWSSRLSGLSRCVCVCVCVCVCFLLSCTQLRLPTHATRPSPSITDIPRRLCDFMPILLGLWTDFRYTLWGCWRGAWS